MEMSGAPPSLSSDRVAQDLIVAGDDLNSWAVEMIGRAVDLDDAALAFEAVEVARLVFQDPQRYCLDSAGEEYRAGNVVPPLIDLGDWVWEIRDGLTGYWAAAALRSAALVPMPWDDGQGDQRNAVFGLRDLVHAGEAAATSFVLELASAASEVVSLQALEVLKSLCEDALVSQDDYAQAQAKARLVHPDLERCSRCGRWNALVEGCTDCRT